MAHKLCRFLALTLLAALASSPLYGEGAGIQWQFYGDFDSNLLLSDATPTKPTWSFQQNHASLFAVSTSGTPVNVMVDVLHPGDLFQFSFVLGPGTVTLGRALIPFGTFDFHHLYGGRQDDSGTFLPKLWSDYGIIYSPAPLGPISSSFYVMNGMAAEGFQAGGLTPRVYAATVPEADLSKVVGGQIKLELPTDLSITASGSWEPAIAMAGLDGAWDLGTFAFKAGAIAQAVFTANASNSATSREVDGEDDGEEGDGGDGGSGGGSVSVPDVQYYRWADYIEAKWKVDWTVELRLRGGQMDTNSTLITSEDQANVNLGLVWKLEQYEIDFVYFRNFALAKTSDVGTASNYNQFLVKVLVSL